MLLVCVNRCGGELFRALFAEVDVDSAGMYQDHRITQPGFACLNCGGVAMDLAEVPVEIAAERAEDEPVEVFDVLCPVCETRVAVEADRECPNCGAPLDS
jgi:rubrerythrin